MLLSAYFSSFCITLWLFSSAGCPRGKYSDGNMTAVGGPQCYDCPKSYYCAGGDFVANVESAKVLCPNSMTTIGKRTETQRGCGKQRFCSKSNSFCGCRLKDPGS